MYHIKNDKRSIQSSKWIYSALEALMQEKEYSEITVTDIVNKANLGRTTFYRNFDTIDDILKMKLDEKFEGLTQYLRDNYKPMISGNNTVFLKPFLKYWYVNSHIIELLIQANKTELIYSSLKTLINNYKSFIIKPNNNSFANINFIIELKATIMVNILQEWIKTNMSITPDELSDIIITEINESFINGILL